MIVSCPACSARYRIDPNKIKGRGAKITCPRCAHKFVVYKGDEPTRSAEPPSLPLKSTSVILTRDFRRVGVTWRVRKGAGVTFSFHDLQTLLGHVESGKVEGDDVLSYDARTWVPLDTIDDLTSYFEDIWRKAERGDIGTPAPPQRVQNDTDDMDEGPTTIMGHGHALMDDIRKAVADATTPPPSPSRQTDPWPQPAPRAHSDFIPDDPTTFSRRVHERSHEHVVQPGPELTPSSSDIRAQQPPRPGTPPRSATGTPMPRRHTPAPTPTRVEQETALDNTVVAVTAVAALVTVTVVLVFGLWYAGMVRFGPAPEPPPVPVAPVNSIGRPAQGLPGAVGQPPAPTPPPVTDPVETDPPEPAVPAPVTPNDLVPSDPAGRQP